MRDKKYQQALIAADKAPTAQAAVAACRRAVAARPDRPEAHINLASLLLANGQPAPAEIHARLAVAAAPDRYEALVNHGSCLVSLGRPDDAVPLLERAAALRPDVPQVLEALAQAYREQGATAAARRTFDRRLALGPSSGVQMQRDLLLPPVPESLLEMTESRDRLEQTIATRQAQDLRLDDPAVDVGVTPFYLPYAGRDDRPVQEALARLYQKACPSLAYIADHCRPAANRTGDGRIRLGVVSAFFTAHTIGQLQRGLMVNLDKSRFALTVFLFAPPTSAIGKQIADAAAEVVILPRRLAAARAQIASCQCDILFYPDIGMDVTTYFLAHARLAPVQCTTWGHPITTGLPNMDYFVSSALMEPADNAAHYSETLVRLKALSIYYHRPQAPTPLPLSYWGLSDTTHVYLCPQTLFKFHPDFDQTLANVLRRDPKGVLVLVNSKVAFWGELLLDRLRRTAPDVIDRLVLLPKQSYDDFLRLMQAAPVILDSWPFGGGNTTLEALAMGTPVVSLPDSHLRGRLTLGFYRKMDVMDAVAESPDHYVDLAVQLGTDATARQKLSDAIMAASERLFEERASIDAWQDFFIDAYQTHVATTSSGDSTR